MTKNNPHRPCLTKKGSTLWSEYNHLFRPRVIENDPLHPRMFGNDLPHPIDRSQSLPCYRDRCALEIKIDEKSQNMRFGAAKWFWPCIFVHFAKASKRHNKASHLLLIG